ncbi:MAG: HD domain-containing protein [Bacteriovoracaceae bacterium]|jgi:HD-GYP domain-containing protein (c-di-GMP phosphodiesterase class II)|nr:HD domain-containing protein [Bacteriovoracaceae bacterium]
MSVEQNIKFYFQIDKSNLGIENIFSAHLYLYNPQNSKVSVFLYANSVLDGEKQHTLDGYLEKGARLYISRNQKKSFLTNTNQKDTDIPSLSAKTRVVDSSSGVEESQQIEENDQKLIEDFETAITSGAYNSVYNIMISEIQGFPKGESEQISLAISLADQFNFIDNYLNRSIVTTFVIAKLQGIVSAQATCELFTCAYLHHIGLSQISRDLLLKPYHELTSVELKEFEKHPKQSSYVAKKIGLSLTKDQIRTIEGHHERVDGSGYPDELVERELTLGSQILSLSSTFIDVTMGKIDKTQNAKSAFAKIKSGNDPGIGAGFNGKALEILEQLITKKSA